MVGFAGALVLLLFHIRPNSASPVGISVKFAGVECVVAGILHVTDEGVGRVGTSY